jgi:hypothetical protein
MLIKFLHATSCGADYLPLEATESVLPREYCSFLLMRYCSIVQARWMIRTNLSPVSSTYSVNATHENVDEKRPSIFFWVRHVILLTTAVSAVLFFVHPKSPMFGFREFAG